MKYIKIKKLSHQTDQQEKEEAVCLHNGVLSSNMTESTLSQHNHVDMSHKYNSGQKEYTLYDSISVKHEKNNLCC